MDSLLYVTFAFVKHFSIPHRSKANGIPTSYLYKSVFLLFPTLRYKNGGLKTWLSNYITETIKQFNTDKKDACTSLAYEKHMIKPIIILMMMIMVIIIFMMVRMILPNASTVCGWAESIHFIGSTPAATTMLHCTIHCIHAFKVYTMGTRPVHKNFFLEFPK